MIKLEKTKEIPLIHAHIEMILHEIWFLIELKYLFLHPTFKIRMNTC
jgi:hypothetical protein